MSGWPNSKVELWRIAAEFTDVTPERVRRIVEYLGFTPAHWTWDGLTPDAANLVRRELRSRGATLVSKSVRVDVDMSTPGPEFEARMVKMFEQRMSEQVGDRCTLRVHAVNREIVESDEVAAGPGLETIVVADDLGRRVEIAAMALGPGDSSVTGGLWPVWYPDDFRALDYQDAIVSRQTLDASKTYLVLVIEHPDDAISHDASEETGK